MGLKDYEINSIVLSDACRIVRANNALPFKSRQSRMSPFHELKVLLLLW